MTCKSSVDYRKAWILFGSKKHLQVLPRRPTNPVLYTPKPFLGHQTSSMMWFPKVWKSLCGGSGFRRFCVFTQHLTFSLWRISPARTYPPMGSGVLYPKTFLRAPDKTCAQYAVVSEGLEGFIRWISFHRFRAFGSLIFSLVKDVASPNIISTHGIWSCIPQNLS